MIQTILKMIPSNKIAVVITAAGSSTRIGSGSKKEYLPYKNGTVLSNCAKTFLKAFHKKYSLEKLIITYPESQLDNAKAAVFNDTELCSLLESFQINIDFVPGSSTRQKSVFCALDYIKKNCTSIQNLQVLIHDGARPFVSEKIILDVSEAAINFGSGVPGITPTDTIKEIDENGFIKRHLVRKNLSAVQTPQGFNFEELYAAHLEAMKEPYEFTDDTEIYGKYCRPVKLVEGSSENIKITYPEDLEMLKK